MPTPAPVSLDAALDALALFEDELTARQTAATADLRERIAALLAHVHDPAVTRLWPAGTPQSHAVIAAGLGMYLTMLPSPEPTSPISPDETVVPPSL